MLLFAGAAADEGSDMGVTGHIGYAARHNQHRVAAKVSETHHRGSIRAEMFGEIGIFGLHLRQRSAADHRTFENIGKRAARDRRHFPEKCPVRGLRQFLN